MSAEQLTQNDNQRVLASLGIVGALLVGLLMPDLSRALFPYMFHFLFLLVVFTFCSLNANLLEVVGNVDGNAWLALTWQMAGIPALTAMACFLLNADLLTTSVLIATTTAGSVFASPTIANLVGLDRRLAVRTMLLSTLAMPVSLLFFGELTGILPTDISLHTYVSHVVFFLLLPLVLAMGYWELQPQLKRPVRVVANRAVSLGSTLALMGFCVAVMHKIHGSGAEHHARLLYYLGLISAVVVSIYVVTGLVFAHLGRRTTLTIGMLAANRNIALSFVLISEFLPREALTYVAVAQFPIFLAPIFMRSIGMFLLPARPAEPEADAKSLPQSGTARPDPASA